MRTTEIINKLDKKELMKWEAETKSILGELNWKLTKAERALYLHYTALQENREKLQANQQRAEETRMALLFLSETHPLRAKCEDNLYKTEINIFRLENKLKSFSNLKLIQLEIKKIVVLEEIRYYEGILKEIKNLLNPPVVLRRVLNTPDGEIVRNSLPDEGECISHFQYSEPARNRAFQPPKDKISRRLEMTTLSIRLKQEAIDVGNLFLSVG